MKSDFPANASSTPSSQTLHSASRSASGRFEAASKWPRLKAQASRGSMTANSSSPRDTPALPIVISATPPRAWPKSSLSCSPSEMAPQFTAMKGPALRSLALLVVIGVGELTRQGQEIIAETYLVFELWFTIAAIYLILTLSLSLATQAMEKRMASIT